MTRLIVVLGLLLGSGVAHAGWNDDQFAHFMSVDRDKVDAVEGYRLAGVRGYTHVLVGRYQERSYHFYAVVLLDCDEKQCRGERVYLEGADDLELHGLVDLAGEPGPLRGERLDRRRALREQAPMGKKRLRKPALVLELKTSKDEHDVPSRYGRVSGTSHRDTLYAISLVPSTKKLARRVMQVESVSTAASGVGHSTTFRLGESEHGGVRDIIATEHPRLDKRSACLPPKPFDYKLTLVQGRYKRAGDFDGPRGCH